MAGSAVAAAALRQLRLAARLSQEQLAERCRVSERTIRTLESGTAKRPHRDTLDALARALELTPVAAADFVASWRRDHQLMQDVLAGRSPDVDMQAELTAQRKSIRELAIHQRTRIDERGRWLGMNLRRTFEVTGPGVDRFAWLTSADSDYVDPEQLRVRATNMTVVAEHVLADVGAKAFVGDLGRELAVGETYTVEYDVGYAPAHLRSERNPDDDEALFAIGVGLPVLTMEVHFAAPPPRVWRVRLGALDQAAELVEPLTVNVFGTAHCALAPAPPGVHGMRWEWDEDHCR